MQVIPFFTAYYTVLLLPLLDQMLPLKMCCVPIQMIDDAVPAEREVPIQIHHILSKPLTLSRVCVCVCVCQREWLQAVLFVLY